MNKAVFGELASLVKDLRSAKSESVKDFVEERILKEIEGLKADVESWSDSCKDSAEPAKPVCSGVTVPVYFDLWTECDAGDIVMKSLRPSEKSPKRKVLEHVYSPELVRSDSGWETVIRSYDKQNNVVYENGKLAGMCPNYAEKLRRALGEVKKAIADGKAGLTSRFDDPTPEYAKASEPRYSDDEIAKVQTPVVNPERPLDPIDDAERAMVKSSIKTKTGKNQTKQRKKAGKKTAKKVRESRLSPADFKFAVAGV